MSSKNKIIVVVFAIISGLGLLAGLLGGLALLGVYLYIAPDLPSVDSLKEMRLQEPLRVYSFDGKLVAEYGEKRRVPLTIELIPDLVKQAFLASEDDRFHKHPGVDYQGLIRAVINQLITGDKSQGGSTITMQVARNFFLTREKTYLRKINEIFLALKIEKELSKDNILELYLNKIYLGRRAYGVAAAAKAYYGKGIDELNLAQIAMIAGLPKAPSAYNPVANPERALTRRNYVLGRMLDLEMITEEAYEMAFSAAVSADAYDVLVQADAPYIAEMVRAEVVERFGDEAYTSGLKVFTTLDSHLQAAANKALRDGLLDYEERHGYRGPARRLGLPDGTDWISIYSEADVLSATATDEPLGSSEESVDPADTAELPEAVKILNRKQQAFYELSQQEAEEVLKGVGRYGNIRPAIVLSFEEKMVSLNEVPADAEEETAEGSADSESEAELESAIYAEVYLGEGEYSSLSFEAVQWARPYITVDRRGAEPKSIFDVLNVGDVVWLRAQEGGWKLAQLPVVEGALVSLDPQTGAVVSMVGGFDYFKSKFNRAVQAKRQAGSSFKPFVYAAALENDFTAASIINDAPVVFDDPALEGKWRPENYSGKFFGPTRLREGLVKSRNLVSIRLLIGLGIGKARAYIKQFGFGDKSVPRDLSLALGSGTVTPLELVSGFGVFANGGFRVQPYFIDRIEAGDGRLLWQSDYQLACLDCFVEQFDPVVLAEQYDVEWPVVEAEELAEEPPFVGSEQPASEQAIDSSVADNADEDIADSEQAVDSDAASDELAAETLPPEEPQIPKRIVRQAEQVLNPQVSYIMNSILRDVVRRGTGVRARVLGRNDLAGKTGTTNDQHDAWFSGFNHRYVTSVWVGFDTHKPLGAREAGSQAALPIWIAYMKEALSNIKEQATEQPQGIVTIRIDAKTGLLATSETSEAIFELFRLENVPKQEADESSGTELYFDSQGEPVEGGAADNLF